MQITIRPATLVDVDSICQMWQQLASQHSSYNAQRWNWRADAAEQFGRYFDKALASEQTIALVATAGESATAEIVGFVIGSTAPAASVLKAETKGEVSDLFVAEGFRGRKIGKRLMDAAMDVMIARGASHVTVSVASDNDGARAMYEKMGFGPCIVQYYKKLPG